MCVKLKASESIILTRRTMFNYYYNWPALITARTIIIMQVPQCIASAYM